MPGLGHQLWYNFTALLTSAPSPKLPACMAPLENHTKPGAWFGTTPELMLQTYETKPPVSLCVLSTVSQCDTAPEGTLHRPGVDKQQLYHGDPSSGWGKKKKIKNLCLLFPHPFLFITFLLSCPKARKVCLAPTPVRANQSIQN